MDSKRTFGITASAVVAILGSVLLLLIALLMPLSVLAAPREAVRPPLLVFSLVVMGVSLTGLGAWGIATAVALFRLRPWSRTSMLIFSGLLVFFSISTALATVSIPLASNSAQPALPPVVKLVVLSFYSLLALLGTIWLFYFSRTRIRACFDGDAPGQPGRPLSISIIGWVWLAGGVIGLALIFTPFPTMMFTILLTGWGARASYLCVGAISLWTGAGLLRLKPSARIAGIAISVVYLLNGAATVWLPGSAARMQSFMEAMPSALMGPAPATPAGPSQIILAFSAALTAVPL